MIRGVFFKNFENTFFFVFNGVNFLDRHNVMTLIIEKLLFSTIVHEENVPDRNLPSSASPRKSIRFHRVNRIFFRATWSFFTLLDTGSVVLGLLLLFSKNYEFHRDVKLSPLTGQLNSIKRFEPTGKPQPLASNSLNEQNFLKLPLSIVSMLCIP